MFRAGVEGGAVEGAGTGRRGTGRGAWRGPGGRPSAAPVRVFAGGALGRLGRAGDGLPEPGRAGKEYTDDAGKVSKVIEWFGYKLHLLVDVRHEVAMAYRITASNAADNEELVPLLAGAQANLPAGRIETLASDKADDDGKVHRVVDAAGIGPLIENRSLWKDQTGQMLPGHDGRSNVFFDEAGTIYCYDKVSDPPVRRPMAYIGHEPSRRTLKYRCPAMHRGLNCASHSLCNAGQKYGKTVRVKQQIDLRRFPPVPRATRQFERLYRVPAAVERINARLNIFWGADDGHVVGAARFHAHVGAARVAHGGPATLLAMTRRKAGPLGLMRLSSIAKALRQKLQVWPNGAGYPARRDGGAGRAPTSPAAPSQPPRPSSARSSPPAGPTQPPPVAASDSTTQAAQTGQNIWSWWRSRVYLLTVKSVGMG